MEFRFLIAVDLLLAVLLAIAIVAAIAASRTAVVAASASGVVAIGNGAVVSSGVGGVATIFAFVVAGSGAVFGVFHGAVVGRGDTFQLLASLVVAGNLHGSLGEFILQLRVWTARRGGRYGKGRGPYGVSPRVPAAQRPPRWGGRAAVVVERSTWLIIPIRMPSLMLKQKGI